MAVVHWVTGKWVDGLCVYEAACGEPDPLAGWWTINKDLVTCWRCKQRT